MTLHNPKKWQDYHGDTDLLQFIHLEDGVASVMPAILNEDFRSHEDQTSMFRSKFLLRVRTELPDTERILGLRIREWLSILVFYRQAGVVSKLRWVLAYKRSSWKKKFR